MFRSSHKHSRKPELRGSRLLRAYSGSDGEERKGHAATYFVKVVDERYQIIAFNVRHGLFVRFVTEYAAESIMKLR